MQISDMLLTMGSTHGRTGKQMTPKGIVVHYVGNPGSSAAGNRNYFENGAGGNYTSAHYIIGLAGEILRCIPENECAQHAGKSYASKYDAQAVLNNSMYIGIENCHPDAAGKFNSNTYTSLVELCADICKRYGFDPVKDIFRHYDVSGKSCPLYYVNNPNSWKQLLADIGDAVSPKQTTVRFDLFGEKTVDIPGWLIDGSNYVQARALLEAMEFVVGWENGVVTVRIKWPISDEDYECLCKIVEAEAGGEDEKGKILVGNVVMNRVASKQFPDGIQTVVFQEKQFAPTSNGAYDKASPSSATRKAVDACLCGNDYSQGALFFRTVQGAEGSWHETALKFLFQYGEHRFYC